ncbi:MAG: hypothetical protein IPJ06_14850 [Saprospiraceae bacterium]|nr:hypothetical protein [Saprospiraceae bacterium]
MKNSLLTIIFFAATISLAAQEKGLTPLAGLNTAQTGSTYAVVVGISDYQDTRIPDLRFADRDAEAFYRIFSDLRQEDHWMWISWCCSTRRTTMAQFASAPDWLWEVSKGRQGYYLLLRGMVT